MNKIETILLATVLYLATAMLGLDAETNAVKLTAPDSGAPYRAGQFSISPYTAFTASNLKPLDGRQAAGLAIGYHLTSAIEATVEAAASDTDERAIDQFGAHGRGYLPVWKTGFAFYGELGWQRFNGDEDRDFMSTGAGAAFRAKKAGLRVGARRLENFKAIGAWQFLIAAEARF